MPKHVEVEVSKLEGPHEVERGKFVQAYEYTPPEGELVEKRGRLFAVVDITGGPNFDATLAGKLVWDTLTEEYFAETEEAPLKTLEQAILLAKNQLANPAPEEPESGPKAELHLAVVVVWGGLPAGKAGVLYLARFGKPTLLLKRGGQVRELLTGEEPSSVNSMLVEDGDVVILGSSAFSKSFPSANLPEISFLEREFASGAPVPGMAAIILKLKVPEVGKSEVASPAGLKMEEESEAVPFAQKRRIKLPSLRSLWEKRPKRRQSLPFPSEDKVKISAKQFVNRIKEEVGTRIAAGRERSLAKRHLKIGLPKAIAALALIFLASVSLTIWQQRQRTRTEEFSRLLSSSEATIAEAEDLVGLADERAKELWGQAAEMLERATAINPKAAKLTSLKERAQTLFNSIERITPVTEKHLFYDLTLQPFGLAQGEQIQALSLAGSEKVIYVAEEKTGTTFAIARTTSPQAEEIASEIKGARKIVVGGDFLYLLTAEGFYRYNLKTGKKDTPIKFDRYNKVTALDLYFERHIYFLIPSENQIIRFWEFEGSYTRGFPWLKESVVLEETVDFTVDGSIWILRKDGSVLNLLGGEKELFSLKNLPTAITKPTAIYTRPNFKNLYIADGEPASPSQGGRAAEGEPRQGRVVVFEKNGQFAKQFKGEVLTDLIDLWVSADEKTLFLLTKDKIYKISL